MVDNKKHSVHKQELRERIVETAMRAFSMQGIRAVKMDDVAKMLGISKRTLYELYENKEYLIAECIRKYRSNREEEMQKVAVDGRNVMDILFYAYKIKVDEFKHYVPQFYADLVKYPRVMALMEESRLKNHNKMMEFLKRGVEEGYFREDADYEIVSTLFDAIGNYIMSHQMYLQYSIEELFHNLIFISLRGFCTPLGVETLDRILANEEQ